VPVPRLNYFSLHLVNAIAAMFSNQWNALSPGLWRDWRQPSSIVSRECASHESRFAAACGLHALQSDVQDESMISLDGDSYTMRSSSGTVC